MCRVYPASACPSPIFHQSPTVIGRTTTSGIRTTSEPAQWHRYVACRHTIRAATRSHRSVLIAAIFAQPSSLCDSMTGESVTESALEKAASTHCQQSRHEFSSQPSSLCGSVTGKSVTESAQPAHTIVPASMHYRHPVALSSSRHPVALSPPSGYQHRSIE